MQQEVKKELIFRIWVRFPVEEPMNAILEECPSEHAEREESRPPKSTDNHTSNYYYLLFFRKDLIHSAYVYWDFDSKNHKNFPRKK